MCECGAMREERDADVVEGGGSALCATGAEEVEADITWNRRTESRFQYASRATEDKEDRKGAEGGGVSRSERPGHV